MRRAKLFRSFGILAVVLGILVGCATDVRQVRDETDRVDGLRHQVVMQNPALTPVMTRFSSAWVPTV